MWNMERHDKSLCQAKYKQGVKISFIKIQNYAKDWFQMPCYRYTITNRKKNKKSSAKWRSSQFITRPHHHKFTTINRTIHFQDSCCLQDYGQLDNIMQQQQPYHQSLLYGSGLLTLISISFSTGCLHMGHLFD